MTAAADEKHRGNAEELVLILAPGFVEPREFRFSKNTRVKQTAAAAAQASGYRPNAPGLQTATTGWSSTRRIWR
jgi:hypothetical protein